MPDDEYSQEEAHHKLEEEKRGGGKLKKVFETVFKILNGLRKTANRTDKF